MLIIMICVYAYLYKYTYSYKSYIIITYTTNIVTTNLIKKEIHVSTCMYVNIYIYMYIMIPHTPYNIV